MRGFAKLGAMALGALGLMPTAPAQGLCLERVDYDAEVIG